MRLTVTSWVNRFAVGVGISILLCWLGLWGIYGNGILSAQPGIPFILKTLHLSFHSKSSRSNNKKNSWF